MKVVIYSVLCSIPAFAQAQALYFAPTPTPSPSANATVSLCADPQCESPAISFTDDTASMACPSSKPSVLSNGCLSATDSQGRFGFWLSINTEIQTGIKWQSRPGSRGKPKLWSVYFYRVLNADGSVVKGSIIVNSQ